MLRAILNVSAETKLHCYQQLASLNSNFINSSQKQISMNTKYMEI